MHGRMMPGGLGWFGTSEKSGVGTSEKCNWDTGAEDGGPSGEELSAQATREVARGS